MIEAPEFLPLGSVVKLKGNEEHGFLLVGRALVVETEEGEKEYFDYAFALYPEGLIGEAVIYSNHDCISEVLFVGFADEEDAALLEQTYEVLPLLEVPRATPTVPDTW